MPQHDPHGAPQRFVFRPSPSEAPLTFELQDGRLRRIDADGAEAWSVDLAALDKATLSDRASDARRLTRFDLQVGAVFHPLTLEYAPKQADRSPDVDAFRALITAICAALPPDFPIESGVKPGWGAPMFWFGVATVLFAIGVPIAALVAGVAEDRFVEGSVAVVALLWIGVMMVRAEPPWAPPTVWKAKDAPGLFRLWDAFDK